MDDKENTMTTTHTPGPWDIKDDSKLRITAGKYGLHIAYIATTGMGDAGKANANLIAAAPALLEALELALAGEQHDHLCDYAMSFTRVRIADGRTLRGRKTYEALANQCERDAEPCNCWVSKAKAAIAAAKGGAR